MLFFLYRKCQYNTNQIIPWLKTKANSLTRSFVNSLFLNSGVLFLCFCHDSSRHFGRVACLRIGRSRADRAPCLTARHAHCHADHRYQYK